MAVRIFRWQALIPLALFLGVIGLLWYLYLDRFVERRIENYGTEIVGALVEVDEADVRLTEGYLSLRGFRVTNPDAPMTNLIDIEEVIADLRVAPLLEKKIYVDTVAIRGMQFGTPRETSGAIETSTPTSREIRRQINTWGERIRIPDFSLEGLSQVVNVSAIRPESLQTIAFATDFVQSVDSSRQAWEATLTRLNPRPLVDSGQAMLQRLQGASVQSLGVPGLVQTLRSARNLQTQLDNVSGELRALDDRARAGVADLRARIQTLDEVRARDLAYARSLLQIPSLDTPDLSPSIFGSFAVSKIKPFLYWAEVAQRYVPPGLDPRRRPGPKRLRLAGDDIAYPAPGALPKFTLAYGEASLAIGGQGAGAGAYQGVITGLTSAPALLGQPLRLSATRRAAVTGPGDIDVNAVIDHTTAVARDSADARVAGITLPTITVPGLGATLALGSGVTDLAFARTGDQIAGTLRWQSRNADWQRPPSQATGLRARVENLLWRTVSAVRDVDIEVRFSGNALGPSIAVRSNVGSAIASSLRQQLRAEIDSVATMVRAEVDRLVGQPIRDARARVQAIEAGVQNEIATRRAALDETRAQLEARIRELTRLVPGGIGAD